MIKVFKRGIVAVVVLVCSFGLWSFTQDDKYFEIAKNLDVFATLYKEVNRYYVDDINSTKLMKTGIDAMLESLDPYTNYIPEDDIEDFRTMQTGQYGGIGAVIGHKNGKNMILMPYENFPAFKGGLRIGDELIEIDGVNVKDKTTSDISKLLKGQANTKVKISYKRFGQTDLSVVELTRQKIKIDNIPYIGLVQEDIGYFHLTDFTMGAAQDVKSAVVKLKQMGAKKIIFDLRDNPGGLLNEAVDIANLFIPSGKEVVSTKGKVAEWNKSYLADKSPLDLDIPIVVLTSGHSASASEIVSGVLQDYDRGVLVGERTFGKGLVQNTRPLSFNSEVKITTAKYYIPSGRCIQAIDYSKRKNDGGVAKIADSLRVAFKTKNGRLVYDGGGVSPDIKVEDVEYAPITLSLVRKDLIFDYAGAYFLKHATIAPAKSFHLTDKEYDEFVKWLTGKEYDYKTKVETDLEQLTENAKKEKYYEGIKSQIESLKTQIGHNKEQDLGKFKPEIKEQLEREIVARYYFQKGIIESSFDSDRDILAAIKVLNDSVQYNLLLKTNLNK